MTVTGKRNAGLPRLKPPENRYPCRDERCRQGFASENERDDHELAARHWDE